MTTEKQRGPERVRLAKILRRMVRTRPGSPWHVPVDLTDWELPTAEDRVYRLQSIVQRIIVFYAADALEWALNNTEDGPCVSLPAGIDHSLPADTLHFYFSLGQDGDPCVSTTITELVDEAIDYVRTRWPNDDEKLAPRVANEESAPPLRALADSLEANAIRIRAALRAGGLEP